MITSPGAHSSVKAMADVIDVDIILVNSDEKMHGINLKETIESLDPEIRDRLFAVVATSGTTNAGIIDDLKGIAEVCEEEHLWFHVDGAYGGAALAVEEVRHLFEGIEKADSFTIDPHKWLFTPYDCGAVIYKEPELAKKTHTQEGSYLDIFKDEGATGFNPSDYQIQLTRRLRGMPLWFSLAMHGTKVYRDAIARGIELAKIAGDMVKLFPHLELVREPSLSCVLFRRKGWSHEDYTNWTYTNHRKRFALVTPTKWKTGSHTETCARFCFINPHTTVKDIEDILMTME